MSEGISVLMVEDEPAVADRAATHLERIDEGLTVTTETDATAVLDRIADSTVHCVVSDYRMPRIDGLELLETVRESHRNLPFILFTGDGSEAVASEAISAGVTDYLPKGTGSEQYELLANGIENAVESYRAECAIAESTRSERDPDEKRAITDGFFEALPDPTYAIAPDGTMDCWNDEFASVVGYDDAAIAGMHYHEFVPDDDRDRIDERIMGVLRTGESAVIESALVTKAGETIPHEFSGARSRRADGTYGIVGVGRDVVEQRRRERVIGALHEATRRLVAAEDDDGVADAVTTTVEEIFDLPIAAVRLYDEESDSLDPVSVTDATHERLGERPRYARSEGFPWRAFRAGEPIVVGEATAPDDIPLRHRLYLPLGDHGTITIASPGEPFDDTTVRLARVLAANAAAALDRLEREERLRRYGRMLDAAGDMIYTLDADGRFRTVNDTLVAKTGYSREELVGEHASMLLDADDVAVGRSVIQRLLADGANAVSDPYEATVHTADGEPIPCETQLTLLETDAGFVGTLGVVRDITARKRHEQLLEALHDATREMMAATTQREVADIAVDTAADVLDMELNGVWLHEAGELRPVAISDAGTELFDTPPTYAGSESLAWTVFESGEMQRHDRVDRASGVYNPETPIRSELLVPLGGYGVLTVGATESGAFDDRDVSLARLLAANVESALERAERERDLERQRDELGTLDHINVVIQDIVRGLVAAATHEEIAATVCERIAAAELYEFAWIAERDAGGEFTVRTGAGIDTDAVEIAAVDGGTGQPSDEFTETGVVGVFEDGAGPWQTDAEPTGPVAAVPLSYNEVVYGVLVVAATRPDAFSERERAGFAVLGEVAGFAIDAAQNMKLLLSDTALALELQVVDEAAFPTTLTRRLDCRYLVDGVVPAADRTVLQYVTVEGADPERVRELAGDSSAVEDCRLVANHDEGGVFEIATRRSPVNSIVDAGGTVEEWRVEDGSGTMVVVVAPETDVRAMVAAFERAHPGSELLSKQTVERPGPVDDASGRRSVDERLTDKQRAALRAAYFAGYYEWPRRSTAEEIADSMGVSSPTLHNHLRKAQQQLLAAFLGEK